MLNENQSIQRGGLAMVKETVAGAEVEKVVANMSANIEQAGNVNIHINIENKSLFDANKEEVKEDISTFIDNVYNAF